MVKLTARSKTTITLHLTPQYSARAYEIATEMGVSPRELLHELIDLYYLETPRHVALLRRCLSRRLNEGITFMWAAQLHGLYLLIKSLLTRIRYL